MEFYLKENGMRAEFDYGILSVSPDEADGFRPFQLMVASIAGCSGSVFRKILDKQHTDYEDLIIHADVERNPEIANRIEKMTLTFTIKGKHLDPDKMERNLALSRKNCSMVRSVEDSIDIKESLKIIELSR